MMKKWMKVLLVACLVIAVVDAKPWRSNESVNPSYSEQNLTTPDLIVDVNPIPDLELISGSDPIIMECTWCYGSRRCNQCEGTGKISHTEYSIDLTGNGGTAYETYETCPLCLGHKECFKRDGKGYTEHY